MAKGFPASILSWEANLCDCRFNSTAGGGHISAPDALMYMCAQFSAAVTAAMTYAVMQGDAFKCAQLCWAPQSRTTLNSLSGEESKH